MQEIVAVEYRQRDWSSADRLAGRVARVAEACAERGVAAVGVAGLLSGQIRRLAEGGRPALLFGLRARTLEAVVAVGGVLAARGFSCVYGWTDESETTQKLADPAVLVGHGLVEAFGADRTWRDVGPGRLREAFEETASRSSSGGPNIWMPAPDRFGRAVDGMFVDEAARRGVDLVWVPGGGINAWSKQHRGEMPVVEARRDQGRYSPDRLARWAKGDRVERGKLRVGDWARRPGRWLREITGVR